MKLVLDTNIVLDLWVFRDSAVGELHAAIANKEVTWLATSSMREELEFVLSYEQLDARMREANVSAQQVLETFDAHALIVEPPPASAHKCRDPDDQKFVDLAVAHDALLLSKDAQVLALRRKLAVAKRFSAPVPAKTGPPAPSASNS
ncbi:MAG TPA: putative toxin-antitoxin system toxin component, PIN family [Ramlibacter sp.]